MTQRREQAAVHALPVRRELASPPPSRPLVVVEADALEAMIERAVRRGVESASRAVPAASTEWLDQHGAAKLLGYSTDYLRKRKDVPVHRVGRKRRYSRAALEAWMQASGKE
jgi:excisionase family DNA binding protein